MSRYTNDFLLSSQTCFRFLQPSLYAVEHYYTGFSLLYLLCFLATDVDCHIRLVDTTLVLFDTSNMAPNMSSPVYEDTVSMRDETESGYASGSSSASGIQEVYFSKPHLKFLNQQLSKLEPQGTSRHIIYSSGEANVTLDILRWAMMTLPSLYQTTAFGLTGLATMDMLSKIKGPATQQVDLIFLDTLYHFTETLSLVDRVQRRYPTMNLHIYKPKDAETPEQFAERYGEKLWETSDELYDWTAKVEPAQRAYAELQVKAVLTGRRKSQGGKRGDLDIIEVDEAGLIKINPLANWSFQDVKKYIDENDVPYNELLDRGYKSIGDWHSTQPVAEGESERAGRWKGQNKSECGIHNKRSRYAQYIAELQRKEEEEKLAKGLEAVDLHA